MIMYDYIRRFFFKITSYIQKKRERKKERDKRRSERSLKETEIRNYFLGLDRESVEQDIKEIIDFFQRHRFSVIPYNFIDNHKASTIEVYQDNDNNMKYVIYKAKRLYFPKNWSIKTIQKYFNTLCIEQDNNSPHCYETNEFNPNEGDIIVDAGAAEGMWALNYVEKVEKVYLFECDQKWLDTLAKTFEPWKEKVTIINKYVSNIDDDRNVTLDSILGKETIHFIKADIEGMEVNLLEGATSILSSNWVIKLLLCTYHSQKDGDTIYEILKRLGFTTEYSKGYMIFTKDKDLEIPYIRRGLIRAKRDG